MNSLCSSISLNLDYWSLHNKSRMRGGLYCCISFLFSVNSFCQSDSRYICDLFGLNDWSDCTKVNYGLHCGHRCPCGSDLGSVALSHDFWCYRNLCGYFSSRLSHSICFLFRFKSWESHCDGLGLSQNLWRICPRWYNRLSKSYNLCFMDTAFSLWLFSTYYRGLICSVYVGL
jgi:hypothetical protein